MQRKGLLGHSNRRERYSVNKTQYRSRAENCVHNSEENGEGKARQGVVGVNCFKDENGYIVVKTEMLKRWRDYMERLLNVEIDWDGIVEYGVVEGPSEYITKTEV